MTRNEPSTSTPASNLARWTLAAFVLTFLAARILVLLIMTRHLPDLFLFVGQTHVHHLNYGIFLLSAVGAWLLFQPPSTMRSRQLAAVLYGIGLGLTFDEFGMWLHLGGSYWQRASYDAIVTLAGLLGLIVVAPQIRHFRPMHWALVVAILAAMLSCGLLARNHLQTINERLHWIEIQGPP
jgi:hypothetical protein